MSARTNKENLNVYQINMKRPTLVGKVALENVKATFVAQKNLNYSTDFTENY